MNLFDVGRVCVKLAGRDAGRKCVIVEVMDDRFVLVDGNVRRKRVNVKHLEPLDQSLEVESGVSHEDVVKLFQKQAWSAWNTQKKVAGAKPVRERKGKEKPKIVPEKKMEKKVKKAATKQVMDKEAVKKEIE